MAKYTNLGRPVDLNEGYTGSADFDAWSNRARQEKKDKAITNLKVDKDTDKDAGIIALDKQIANLEKQIAEVDKNIEDVTNQVEQPEQPDVTNLDNPIYRPNDQGYRPIDTKRGYR